MLLDKVFFPRPLYTAPSFTLQPTKEYSVSPRHPTKARKPATTGNAGATQVKIIAGQWRGRILRFPEVDGLRPTGNRIRETVFNWLMPVLHGSRCLDAFSGSGALGFEALSRGAASAVMLEPDRTANQHLHDNAALLGSNSSKIFGTKAEQWLAIPATQQFDIVFIDPPFTLDLWPDVLEKLENNGWLSPNAWIYIETPKGYTLNPPPHWQQHRSKQAGQVTFSLYNRGNKMPDS